MTREYRTDIGWTGDITNTLYSLSLSLSFSLSLFVSKRIYPTNKVIPLGLLCHSSQLYTLLYSIDINCQTRLYTHTFRQLYHNAVCIPHTTRKKKEKAIPLSWAFNSHVYRRATIAIQARSDVTISFCWRFFFLFFFCFFPSFL